MKNTPQLRSPGTSEVARSPGAQPDPPPPFVATVRARRAPAVINLDRLKRRLRHEPKLLDKLNTLTRRKQVHDPAHNPPRPARPLITLSRVRNPELLSEQLLRKLRIVDETQPEALELVAADDERLLPAPWAREDGPLRKALLKVVDAKQTWMFNTLNQ